MLLVADPENISLLDMRVLIYFLFLGGNGSLNLFFYIQAPEQEISSLIESSPANPFCALSRNPNHPYQIAACTSRRTMILDCRYAEKPLLQWDLGNRSDPPVEVEFTMVHEQRTFLVAAVLLRCLNCFCH